MSVLERSPRDQGVRWLALAAQVGVVVYVLIDVALAILHPGVSLLHNAESDYGNGPFAWLMDLNFLLRCALSLALVAALWRGLRLRALGRLGAALLAVWALASGLLAFVRDDLPGATPTTHGVIHLAAAFLAFLAALLGALLLTFAARAQPALRRVFPALLACWIFATLMLVALLGAGFHPHSLGGLFERGFILGVLLWVAIAGAALWRSAVALALTP